MTSKFNFFQLGLRPQNLRPRHLLFLGFLLSATYGACLNQAVANEPTLSLGINASAWGSQTWNAANFQLQPGFFLSGRARINIPFVEAAANADYVRLEGRNRMQVSVNGAAFFLRLHELYVRVDNVEGNHRRLLGGVGAATSLPLSLGRATVSAGAAALSWQRPSGPTQSMYGVYVGGSLNLRIWKFQNELRVAYYASPQINQDFEGIIARGEPVLEGWQTGFIAGNRLYVEMFRVPLISLGPELQAQITQLPDGTEWVATVGMAGNLGF